MELILGLVVLAVALGVVGAGLGFVVRALRRRRRPAVPPAVVSVLMAQLEALRPHGFVVEDGGGGTILLHLPLLEAHTAAGRAVEEYRVVLRLDEASRTVRLSERRVSKEAGFGGAGLLRLTTWRGPTAGAREREESGMAATPGGIQHYRLDARAARHVVEQALAAAGWQVR